MAEITINPKSIQQLVDQAVEQHILSAIQSLGQDPAWLEKIEQQINQTVVQRTATGLNSIDVGSVIRQRVDENMNQFADKVKKDLESQGIQDLAKQCELTVLDGTVVVENCLTAKTIDIVESARIKDLAVVGTINVDNRSWQVLGDEIAKKTLDKLTLTWQQDLITEVSNKIREQGINFQNVIVDGQSLLLGNQLGRTITGSYLQTVGQLTNLTVKGDASFNNNSLNVLNKRIGINTNEPEMALSVWDEEVNVLTGKFKKNTAYLGTGRAQALAIGINRDPAIEIDVDGLTTVKKMRVGIHCISHNHEVPGWAGTKGDIVFNSSPSINSNVFAWVCLGAHKWKVIKSIE